VTRLGAVVASLIATLAIVTLIAARSWESVPTQPLAFSHKVHAGEYAIPCLYCHVHARRSAIAGIPSVERCMGCHAIMKTDKAEVKKIREYWDRQEPIPWIKIYDQPDFVYFSHKRHVFKEIACKTCHGAVEAMDRVQKAVVLDMDRCVACHMEKKASIDCLTCHQ
jgi:hypothetical protein